MFYLVTDISSNCSDYALAAMLNLVHAVINLLQIAAPIVLVVSLAIVFVRNMASPDDKKANKRLVNIIMATILCFLIPTLLNIVLSLIPENFAGMDIEACWRNAYNVDYSATDRTVGVGMNRIDLKVNFTSLKNAKVSSSYGGGLADCGSTNRAGKQVKCISGSGKNIDVVNYALSFEGYPYIWGAKGTVQPNGLIAFDCSGFVYYVYKQFGYEIGSYTGDLMDDGTAVSSLSEARPGDLLVRHNYDTGEGHVVMYIGNNQIVHAKGSRYGVVISPVSEMSYDTIRRIIQ